MRFMGMYSLLSQDTLPQAMKDSLLLGLEATAQGIVANISYNEYLQPIKTFKCGSNSDFLNAAKYICISEQLTLSC